MPHVPDKVALLYDRSQVVHMPLKVSFESVKRMYWTRPITEGGIEGTRNGSENSKLAACLRATVLERMASEPGGFSRDENRRKSMDDCFGATALFRRFLSRSLEESGCKGTYREIGHK